ncbi:MAG: hypothetical protein IT379_38925 [Deltaproteobacteria bacterium]|nr:hypothetical protein [Deltaproteobacteria bacterium]
MKSEEYESWFVDGERPMTAPEPTAALDLRQAEKAGKKTMIRLENGLKYEGLSLVGAKVLPGGLEDDDPVLPGPKVRGGRRAPAPPPVPADVARDTVKHEIGSIVPTANLRDRVVVAADGDELTVGDDEQTCVGRRVSEGADAPESASILETEWLDPSVVSVRPTFGRMLAPLTRHVRRVAARPELSGALSRVHRVVQRAPVPVIAGVAAILLVGMTAAAMAGPDHGPSIAEAGAPALPIVPLVPASSAPAEIPPSAPEAAVAPAPAPTDEPNAEDPADFDFTGDVPPAGAPGSAPGSGEQAQQEQDQRSSVRSSRASRIRRARIARARRVRIARLRALRARRVRR